MTLVNELVPGDRIPVPGMGEAVYVTQQDHPIWPSLRLVTWRLTLPNGLSRWSLDAMSAAQEVGDAEPSTPEQRANTLYGALTAHED